MNAILT